MNITALAPSIALEVNTGNEPGHDYLCVQNHQLSDIIGNPKKDFKHKPWKGRVVRIRKELTVGGNSNIAIYRLIRGNGSLQINKGQYWLSHRTRGQLDLGPEDKILVDAPFQPWARYCYYNNHLDDATRLSFRIGFWGLILALISISETAFRLFGLFYELLMQNLF